LPQKKKWTKEELSLLEAWRYETSVICGPLVSDIKQAGDTVSRAKQHKAILSVSSDKMKLSNCEAAVDLTANILIDSHIDMPCSVSRRVLSQSVYSDSYEQLTSPAVINSFSSGKKSLKTATEKTQTEVEVGNPNSKVHKSNDAFHSTNRSGTYSYAWVDRHTPLAPAENDFREENTAASFTPATNGEYVKQRRLQISRDMPGAEEDQSDENIISQVTADNTASTERPSILSFPLFDFSPVLPSEPASLPARFPSVSAILKATMSAESRLALSRWEQRMIAELGEDGFKQYQTGW